MVSLLILFTGCARQIHRPGEAEPTGAPEIRVAIDPNLQSGLLRFQGKYSLVSEEATYILDESVGEFTVEYRNHRLILSSSRRRFDFRDFTEIRLLPREDGQFKWNGQWYGGQLIFSKAGGTVAVINRIPLPAYLKGVVPHEIPSHSEEYYPAILAQTVAARSYALNHMEHPADDRFDVYADTRDQVYRGIPPDSPLSEKAVEETRGRVLKDPAGETAETQYHSTCGGILELRPDYESAATETAKKDITDATENCAGSPLYRWVEKINARTILQNLKQMGLLSAAQIKALTETGFSLDIDILSRLESGRVQELLVKTGDLTFRLNEWQVRTALAPENNGILPSNFFFLKNSRQDANLVYIIGAGFGHGRGMCQWGAIGQALKGKSYDEILSFYYPDLSLEKIY